MYFIILYGALHSIDWALRCPEMSCTKTAAPKRSRQNGHVPEMINWWKSYVRKISSSPWEG